ncbi:fructose-bisphosphate aldolase [Fomitopsis serialis]|uniref:fructose-bisphosphate aldolase n=1 Tax=Fomitopsis serialis TaxID=139415 RepID=UPI0020077F51|nr:fructose-bisphosphate aldolase [Neoantrodia serialis]KAH9915619.1 fructose-bisphosphate aldolase [Neoantrodia serialis]
MSSIVAPSPGSCLYIPAPPTSTPSHLTTLPLLIAKMGVLDIVPAGVLTGDNVRKLFEYAKDTSLRSRHREYSPLRASFAALISDLAQNVTSSSVANAVLEAARDIKSPIIIQVSQGGAAYFAGKGLANDKQQASIAGAVAAAHHIRLVAKEYGVYVILAHNHMASPLIVIGRRSPVDENIATCAKYFARMAPLGLWLEMEIGITGGEEDGVDNTSVDNSKLYTQPEDIWDVYSALSKIGPNFSIAAAFGNVHGVYKPGNVRLHPELLQKHQVYARRSSPRRSLCAFLVFHGGSGSTKDEIKTAVQNGVVKMNVDTDTQYAYLVGIRDFVQNKSGYLQSQVGNPEGADKPNKKYYDPRVWVREGEKTLVVRVKEACTDLGNVNRL